METNAFSQTVLDEIEGVTLALERAKADDAYAVHRCINAAQQAHYSEKIVAEKEMWGYDKMSEAD